MQHRRGRACQRALRAAAAPLVQLGIPAIVGRCQAVCNLGDLSGWDAWLGIPDKSLARPCRPGCGGGEDGAVEGRAILGLASAPGQSRPAGKRARPPARSHRSRAAELDELARSAFEGLAP